MKIKAIEDKQYADLVREKIRQNNGYCPCKLIKDDDTKCICKQFRDAQAGTICQCGLYKKLEK